MDDKSRRECLAFLSRHLGAIGCAGEVAWNLREWLREVKGRRSLWPVLESLLPRIRAELELAFLDSHLAYVAATLPQNDEVSASELIAWVENLRFPGGSRIQAPPSDPPVKWMTLSRYRALIIAARIVDERGNLLFDASNPSDLESIEALADSDLSCLWAADEAMNKGEYQPAQGADETETTTPPPGDDDAEANPAESDVAASRPVHDAATESRGGWMGDVELASALGVHSSQIPAFRLKLKRMRDKGELSLDDWQEFENRKRNEPQFHYRANAPAIVAMAKRYSLPK